jgi:tRNA pseudouridine65 synthase
MTLDILFSDPDFVAVDKPSGLLVHRSALANDRVTCLTILRDQLDRWVYPLHRLDRGTSGVLLFALSPESAGRMGEIFAGRSMRKKYLTVVRGYLEGEGTIDYPLAEEPGDEAVEAITRYRSLDRVELPIPVGRYSTARYSLVEVEPLTGRKHQIRRHMAHVRHPVVGDIVHGEGRHNRLFREEFGIGRLLLHARRVEFSHPADGELVTINAPVPEELERLFERLGFGTRRSEW